MSTNSGFKVPARPLVKNAAAIGIVIVLWAGYSMLPTLFVMGHIDEVWPTVLAFTPGILGVAVLMSAGLSRQHCFLAVKPLSWSGLGVLVAVFVFALAAIRPFGLWWGWSRQAALVLAPASGISQEMSSRSSLPPAMQLVLKKRQGLGLIVHSVPFGLWHIGPLFVGAPLWTVIAVMLVPFLSGIGWGWQVLHDRTVLWAIVQHSLIRVVGLQFAVPG